MRICVVGAGAVGGYLAVLLYRAGNDVTVIARGAHLAAIRKDGLRLLASSGEEIGRAPVRAAATCAEAGRHDLILLTVKAHQVQPVVHELRSLMHPETVLVPMQNGIPWWYFQRHGGDLDGRIVEAVDLGGEIARSIDPACILGSVVYPATTIVAPGVVRHVEGNRFPLGELDGVETERVTQISQVFVNAGLKSPVLPDIRSEIWLKLWGNLTFNPISALTHAMLVDVCEHPHTRELARNMMLEAQTVANKLGRTLRVSIDQRIEGAARVGKHKTSMLQDLEAGRYPEIDALVGSVIELGRLTDTPTPHIAAVYACLKLLSQKLALEQAVVQVAPLARVAA